MQANEIPEPPLPARGTTAWLGARQTATHAEDFPYMPYAEKPAPSELPYKPYGEKPAPDERPYEPYKDI